MKDELFLISIEQSSITILPDVLKFIKGWIDQNHPGRTGIIRQSERGVISAYLKKED